MKQSRKAHHTARPHHFPRRGLACTDAGERGRVGYATGARRDQRREQRRDQRRDQRRGRRPRRGPGASRRPAGGAGLRSLPAKQHAPKARPTTNHRQWPAAVVPSRPSSTNGCTAWTAPWRGAGHSRLTAGHRAPAAPPGPGRAWRQPGRGEEESSPRTPLLLGTTGTSRVGPRGRERPSRRRRVTVRWARNRRGGCRSVGNKGETIEP
jgi:hypothetical protein